MDYERELNSKQLEAVTHIDGATLILAGAGSGKTRVITFKISYLIENGVNPEHILAVTFTNKAAAEMKQRVIELCRNKKRTPLVTTFHSLGLKILDEEIEKLGYRGKFSIFDQNDCAKIVKDIVKELKIPEDKYEPFQLISKISMLKMNLTDVRGVADDEIRQIFSKYQEYLKSYNAIDFDDLIKLPLQLFKNYPETLEKYRKKWKYLLVDEYQDTSLMQYEMIKLLAITHKHISVVGDDDQSIYSWRGANHSNIEMFEKDFAPVREIHLEQNYRSTKNILDAANSVIKNNSIRKAKKLWTKGDSGEKITVYEAENEEAEAQFLIDMIIQYKAQDFRYSDFGVLFRMNSQSRPLEEKLREFDLPYKLIGAMKFFERAEVKDILSYMRFIANTDDEVSLHRIINNPKRGIGNSTLLSLLEYSKEHKIPLYSSIKIYVDNNALGEKATQSLEDFYKLIEKYREKIFKPKNISRTVNELIEEIDYKSKLVSELKIASKINYRLSNINQLIQSISRYETNPDNFNPSIYGYLQKVSMSTKEDDQESDYNNKINMMSIHSSKGLEFKVVFIVGVEEGLIPHDKTLEETGTNEEERRLFYVAVTRAQKKLFMSYPKMRMKYFETMSKSPSSFISEIPPDLLEFISNASEKECIESDVDPLISWLSNKKISK